MKLDKKLDKKLDQKLDPEAVRAARTRPQLTLTS